MTWGASLMRLPDDMPISEIAQEFGDDWKPEPVGNFTDVRQGLEELFPNADHRNGQTNFCQGYARVQFNYSDRSGKGVVDSIGVVPNGDVDSIPALKAFATDLTSR